MDSVSARGLIVVAAIQAAVAAAALVASPAAAIVAAAIGVLAIGRFFSLSLFARTMAPGSDRHLRLFATSAWVLGFVALLAAVAATAVRFRPALPWAAAAAFGGPVGLSALAFGSGIGALAAGRHRGKGRAMAATGGEH